MNFWIYLYNQRSLYYKCNTSIGEPDVKPSYYYYYKYLAEFPSIFTVYYNYISIFSYLFRSILNLHTHFKYVKKISNEKFLDIRELDENFLTYYKIPRYIEW